MDRSPSHRQASSGGGGDSGRGEPSTHGEALRRGQNCAHDPALFRSLKRRVEVSSTGIDEYLQLIGGGPDGSIVSTGLRVPTAPFSLPLPDEGELGVGRYLFELATVRLGVGRRIRVVNIRQFLTIGVAIPGAPGAAPFVIERPVVTPAWRFSDANVAWFLRRVSSTKSRQKPLDSDNFRFRFSSASSTGALLYEDAQFPAADLSPSGRPDFYTTLTGYVPPNGGKPYGQPIDGQVGEFRDIRFPFDLNSSGISIPVEGPCSVTLYASVRQSNPETRPVYPGAMPTLGLTVEDQFLVSVPTAIYWRVGGAIVYDDES